MNSSENNSTLVRFLSDQANLRGDTPAFFMACEDGYRSWSYDDLWNEAGRVAEMLQRRGLRKGDRAVLCGMNSVQWALAFFGCIRAGVVVVPLDVGSGDDFVQRVTAKTRPSLAFVSDAVPFSSGAFEVPKISLESLEDELTDGAAPAFVEIRSEDLVEIMFTSGTTGTPKGVMLTHTNLVSNLHAIRDTSRGGATTGWSRSCL